MYKLTIAFITSSATFRARVLREMVSALEVERLAMICLVYGSHPLNWSREVRSSVVEERKLNTDLHPGRELGRDICRQRRYFSVLQKVELRMAALFQQRRQRDAGFAAHEAEFDEVVVVLSTTLPPFVVTFAFQINILRTTSQNQCYVLGQCKLESAYSVEDQVWTN